MKVGEICRREVVTAARGTSVAALARLMRDRHVGSVLVVEGSAACSRPLGIVTDRDLVVEVLAAEVDLEAVTAGDLMGGDLLAVDESASVTDVVELMRARGVRRAPVVDGGGWLAGIVSADDLLRRLADELCDLARLVEREQRREAVTRTTPP